MKILVTGATGKVGQVFLRQLFNDERFAHASARALCNNREVETHDRLDMVKGSISERKVVKQALDGITHVVHLATCKEVPETVMDVSIKGLFWLLEESRISPTFERFVHISGDASVGHFFYNYDRPITEEFPLKAYPGCYALSKALEETMIEQYYHQYDFDGCCLRAPWIMEKDDFKLSLSFGEDVFGGPRWCDLVSKEEAATHQQNSTIPVMLDPDGIAVTRNFVHAEDLVSAILSALEHPAARQQLFNISMDEPVNYQLAADYLKATRQLDCVGVKTPFYSTWLDNSKARLRLDWSPDYDLTRLIDSSWDYQRDEGDERKIWYPG
ncbi:MAG: NAD(P)-dependent oxidoreductase [Verrucomicrobiota bacterium]